jgi:hypothetical protein
MNSADDGRGDKLDKMFDELKENLDFSVVDMLDSVGDQAVMALVVDPKLSIDLDKFKPNELASSAGAVAYLIHVGKKEAAEKIVKSLRQKLFDDDDAKLKSLYVVKKKKNGFNASPEQEGMPHVRVRFVGDDMAFAVGAEKYVKRVMAALKDGKDTLGDAAAHKAAMDAIGGKPQLLAWFDAGTAAKLSLDAAGDKADDIFDELKKNTGISKKALRIKGDKRVTAAIAIMVEGDGKTLEVEIRALNAPAFGVLGVLRMVTGGGPSFGPQPKAPIPVTPSGPALGNSLPGQTDFVLPSGAVRTISGGGEYRFTYKQRYTYRSIRTMMALARAKLKENGWWTRFLSRHKYRVTKGRRAFVLHGVRNSKRTITLTVKSVPR